MNAIVAVATTLASLTAQAVVATTSKTSPASSGSPWAYVGRMSGATAVAIDAHTVITAAHVGAGNFTLGTKTYHMTSTETAPLISKKTVDLRIVHTKEALPGWYEIGTSVKTGMAFTMVGFGGAGVVNALGNGYTITGSEGQTYGTNVITSKATVAGFGPVLRSDLKKAGQAALVSGDSGGGWFVGSALVGISDFTYTKTSGTLPYSFTKKGNFGSAAVDLTNSGVRTWITTRLKSFIPDAFDPNVDEDLDGDAPGALEIETPDPDLDLDLDPDLDSFEIAPAQAVPEPGTYAALGLGALALIRRRRKG